MQKGCANRGIETTEFPQRKFTIRHIADHLSVGSVTDGQTGTQGDK
jgi:hypothetical protein